MNQIKNKKEEHRTGNICCQGCYKIGKKEAQKLIDEMLVQTNLRNHSREQEMKKNFDQTLKNIIESIKLTIKLYPHKHGEELFGEIEEQIIQKQFNSPKENKNTQPLSQGNLSKTGVTGSPADSPRGTLSDKIDVGIDLLEKNDDLIKVKYVKQHMKNILEDPVEWCSVCKSFKCYEKTHVKSKLVFVNKIKKELGEELI